MTKTLAHVRSLRTYTYTPHSRLRSSIRCTFFIGSNVRRKCPYMAIQIEFQADDEYEEREETLHSSVFCI
jgi:hypothetical protein